MKRFFRPLLAAAFSLALLLSCGRGEPLKTIVILYDNDVHCAIGGYPAVAGLRDAIADTAYVGLVSSGDYLQGGTAGTLSHGGHIIGIMDAMGYDAVGLGNHEFDYFGPRLFELMSQLHAPVVCANLFDARTGERCFDPYVICEFGPKKVAFVGALTPETADAERYAFLDENDEPLYDLKPAEVYSLVQAAADEARAKGADYVIVLSHLGELPSDTGVNSPGLIAATKGIDAVLDGHSHSIVPCELVDNLEGKSVLLSQTGTAYQNVGKLVIAKDGSLSVSLIPLGDITQESVSVHDCVAEVEHDLELVTDQVLGESEVTLRINAPDSGERLVRKAETNAGDFLCDAMRYVMEADVALSNGGGIRKDMPAGTVTYGDVVNTFPFDNFVYKIEATGADILEVLRRNTQKAPDKEDGNFPQCSGIRYTVHTSDHRITDVIVLGKDGRYVPIDPAKTYTLATINYCVNGGGFDDALRRCKVLERSSVLYRDAVSDYITNALGGHIGQEYAEAQGRIRFVK